MNALFDYGEFLICIAPVFLIISAIGLALLWNSWPASQPKQINKEGKDSNEP